ncbi:MAG: phosphoenolpyruvate carboxykinase (GTP) [Candidatus Binatus sp.]|uniref:phosphoenolpyruvate carboxykinase (GTP) n=1 Tax=Candidatus Binatus sp. TaxID=2811406 RepID=UPI00271F2ED8|nr:phosphoenolpyruvate carboxykinase (GTP) [Candidatus Binatus sp.]MDO8432435.1 phosphoenolpyruvate carboxykinase (GTP) [Candidatus Binatus sp.]
MTPNPEADKSPTTSAALSQFVAEVANLTTPDRIVWCDGSEAERDRLTADAVTAGILIPLNPEKKPGCYLHRSNPNDVARTEQLTFVCTPTKEEAGPTNNWSDPAETYARLNGWLKGSMRGRTLYVVPYVMGPLGSPLSKVGVELTDSIYVVLNMRIMTRMGAAALKQLGDSDHFNRGVHCTLDLSPERRLICHFPHDNTIISVGSGYGGNALLSKKCFALRIAGPLGRDEGWFAEHMLILGLESPDGETTYIAAAFPSACGKTNLAMLTPPDEFKGWKVSTIGDDIAWMRVGEDGGLWAVNPENGYFGVAPGTSAKSNFNAMKMVEHDSIFTNVAMTPDGDVWWEGMDVPPPDGLLDWQGRPRNKDSTDKAAHPNSRFTTPMRNNPAWSPQADEPKGVPISAIIFGGRRASTVPLVLESTDWTHGVLMGATMGSETTAAAAGAVGVLRRDPMAMLPFCGYNMGDYFAHWLKMRSAIRNPPRIFMVNWFRKDSDGKFLWPGYGENMRVLKWMLDRIHDRVEGRETPVGIVPNEDELDLKGLDISKDAARAALAINPQEWKAELESAGEFFKRIGRTMPKELEERREAILAELNGAPSERKIAAGR